MNHSPEGAARHLLNALLHAAGAVQGSLERSVEPCGLSLAKMGALKVLAEADGPIPLGQLAGHLCCVKSNVTQLVDRLEADGLARRVPDPADRRSILAVITPAGRTRLAEAGAARERAEQALVAELEPQEIERLAGLFERVSVRAGGAA